MVKTSASIDDGLVAFPEAAARRLAGVTLRQLRYWSQTGLVRPSIEKRFGPRTDARLYGFDDVLALLIAAQLRKQFSLQHIRKVVDYLRGSGYARPLVELRFAVAGTEVYFQHGDGTWEGERRHGQVVLSHVVALEPLRQQIRQSASAPRRQELRGTVERRRKVLGSKPVFRGTRTPVEALFPYVERGFTTAQILEAFPNLSQADVRLARKQHRERGAA